MKLVYRTHHTRGVCFAISVDMPAYLVKATPEKNGKIIPYVSFQGGKMALTKDALDFLHRLRQRSRTTAQQDAT